LALGIRKISIAFLSISLIASFGLTSNQAFAGGFEVPQTCQDCIDLQDEFDRVCLATGEVTALMHPTIGTCEELEEVLRTCVDDFCPDVGGVFEGVDTTSLIVAGAQMNAAWMIPVIVSGIGFAIVIARKF